MIYIRYQCTVHFHLPTCLSDVQSERFVVNNTGTTTFTTRRCCACEITKGTLAFPIGLHNHRHHESATRSLVHPQAGHAPAWRVSQGTTKKTFQLIQGFQKECSLLSLTLLLVFFALFSFFLFFVVDSSQSYKRSPRAQRLAIVFGRLGRYFLGVFSDWIWQP